MTRHTVETAPQLYARIAGVLYVIIIILAVFAPFAVAPSGLTRGDVATTAAEILASKSRYSLGGAAELIVNACDIGVALIFYELLRQSAGALPCSRCSSGLLSWPSPALTCSIILRL